MKIKYVGAFRFPNGDAAASRVLNNARALRLCGHEVEFIAWGGAKRKEDLGKDGLYRYDGFVYRVTNEIDFSGSIIEKAIQYLRAGNKTKQILTEQIGNYDAIIVYNGHLNIIRFLIRLSKKTGVKIIHDLTEWYRYDEIPMISRIQYAYNMKYVQHRIPNKICISSYLERHYQESHNIIVPALCDIEEKKWINENFKNIPSSILDFKGVRFIYAGTPTQKDLLYKEVNVLNRLIKKGKPFQLLILGCERESFIRINYGLLIDKQLHNNIIFLGRVPQAEVPAYYRISDFMILLREPTRKSNAGFPTKFSEAMISGTPVIANITSDLNNYIIEAETGFVVSDCSEEALEAVLSKDSIHDRALIDKMKVKTRLMAAQSFDYRVYADTFKHFIQNLK